MSRSPTSDAPTFAKAARYTTDLLPPDLRGPAGPLGPALERLDPLLRTAVELSLEEFQALVEFVRSGLLDPAARPQRLRRLIPEKLPGGRRNLVFQFDGTDERSRPADLSTPAARPPR